MSLTKKRYALRITRDMITLKKSGIALVRFRYVYLVTRLGRHQSQPEFVGAEYVFKLHWRKPFHREIIEH